jgi:hypothetical protein
MVPASGVSQSGIRAVSGGIQGGGGAGGESGDGSKHERLVSLSEKMTTRKRGMVGI